MLLFSSYFWRLDVWCYHPVPASGVWPNGWGKFELVYRPHFFKHFSNIFQRLFQTFFSNIFLPNAFTNIIQNCRRFFCRSFLPTGVCKLQLKIGLIWWTYFIFKILNVIHFKLNTFYWNKDALHFWKLDINEFFLNLMYSHQCPVAKVKKQGSLVNRHFTTKRMNK